jgi:2-polyprenyl-3-methyl-5-hydroxy-6-metoxy-1,4-benzoquinol methylase
VPRPPEPEDQQLDALAATYDALYHRGYPPSGQSSQAALFLVQKLGREYLAGAHLIDVGCGHGDLADVLALPRASYLGVDISPHIIALDRQRFEGLPNTDHLVGSVTNLPVAAGAYQVAVCLEMMEHLPEALVDRALSELVRVAEHVLVSACCAPSWHRSPIDGSGLHLTVRPAAWWLRRFKAVEGARVVETWDLAPQFWCLLQAGRA